MTPIATASDHRVEELGLGTWSNSMGRYLDIDALTLEVRSADFVVLPYESTEQVTSGVLVEALGAGKPVIASAFPHAIETARDGAGIVVPHADPAALGEAIRNGRRESGTGASHGRSGAGDRLHHVLAGHGPSLPGDHQLAWLPSNSGAPQRLSPGWVDDGSFPVNDDPLQRSQTKLLAIASPPLASTICGRMTDDRGMWEHARYTTPRDEHGYCTDDNARALIVVLPRANDPTTGVDLAGTYIGFITRRPALESGGFHNRRDRDGSWTDDVGPDDSQGRAMWAAGNRRQTRIGVWIRETQGRHVRPGTPALRIQLRSAPMPLPCSGPRRSSSLTS